jgi:ribulose bisphosphate carboxylase small subunit
MRYDILNSIKQHNRSSQMREHYWVEWKENGKFAGAVGTQASSAAEALAEARDLYKRYENHPIRGNNVDVHRHKDRFPE